MTTVRTRFAPSPTGYMHIGNLRTALYTYLIARANKGTFILRIEDTDQERYVEGALDFIYEIMDLTGLHYDEGPNVGGAYGPYIQSERRDIYTKHAHYLVETGAAYPCFCSVERLAAARAAAADQPGVWRYDYHCRDLDPALAQERIAAGESYVIRQKMPTTGKTTFVDAVFGEITVPNEELEDQVLLKADGLPTYNFANVVDDHLMGITHVVRGTEYLSSAPKYNLLYEAFGWEIPTYVHLTPVMKEPGKKLSKRYGDASFNDFYSKGYLKEAIINYIALLGWSPGTEQEIFSLKELEEIFSLSGLSKSPAVFDTMKLRWMNSVYIRDLADAEFMQHALPYLEKVLGHTAIDLDAIGQLLHSRVEVFSEIPDMIGFLADLPDFDLSILCHEKTKTELPEALESLQYSYAALAEASDWQKDPLRDLLKNVTKALGVKTGRILWPLRIAISGQESTPGGAYDLLVLLGKEACLARMQHTIKRLESHLA